jgi:LPXTG-motif cell wall-anchored protein
MVMSMSGTAFAQTSGSPEPSVSASATVSPTVRGTKLTRPGTLPRTGSGLDVTKTAAAGAGLVATGAAAVVVVKRQRAGGGQGEPKHT